MGSIVENVEISFFLIQSSINAFCDCLDTFLVKHFTPPGQDAGNIFSDHTFATR